MTNQFWIRVLALRFLDGRLAEELSISAILFNLIVDAQNLEEKWELYLDSSANKCIIFTFSKFCSSVESGAE